jgi:DNA polymerase III alpha subunit
MPELLEHAPVQETLPFLESPKEGEEIVADYRSLGLTLGRHPLALLRKRFTRMRLSTASELKAMTNGRPARTAGIVTCRQRPGTAQGVVFVTIEDETGYTNVVVWNDLVERQRKELLGSPPMWRRRLHADRRRGRAPRGEAAGRPQRACWAARHRVHAISLQAQSSFDFLPGKSSSINRNCACLECASGRDAQQVIDFVLHDPRVEIAHRAVDRLAELIEAAIAQRL